MYTLQSPGVQVREVDYSDYVANASTSIIGMIGGARRGPITPTLVTSQEDLIKIFGKPSTNDYGVYCALEALTQANQLYYQRILHFATAAKAGSSTDKLNFTAAQVGTTSNGIRIELTYTSDDDFNIVIKSNEQTPAVLETYENCSLTGDDYVVSKINGISEYIIVSVNETGTLATKNFTLSDGTTGATKGTAGTDSTPFSFVTKYYDSTLNNCIIKTTIPDQFGYFDINLSDTDGTTLLESIADVTLDSTDERFVELIVNQGSKYLEITYNTSTEDTTTKTYTISGGNDGISGIDKYDTYGVVAGLNKFSNPEVIDINILCAPGWTDSDVINKGIEICESRGDSIYIADTPFGLTAQEVNDWANGAGSYTDHDAFNGSYGAVYWPWVKVSDPYTRKDIWLPPSGTVVAQYAYNDNVGQPWYAPAGLNRGMLSRPIAIEYSATKGERDTIYGNRNIINPIINYLGKGIVIWGQKTMQRKATALDRVNVRRLMNYLKKIIAASTSYYVFEPNDEHSWDKWVDMVEPKLENVKTLRGIYDYKVEMQPTADEIENNTMPGTLWVKPTKAAEFIPLNFMITPYSTNYEELE